MKLLQSRDFVGWCERKLLHPYMLGYLPMVRLTQHASQRDHFALKASEWKIEAITGL